MDQTLSLFLPTTLSYLEILCGRKRESLLLLSVPLGTVRKKHSFVAFMWILPEFKMFYLSWWCLRETLSITFPFNANLLFNVYLLDDFNRFLNYNLSDDFLLDLFDDFDRFLNNDLSDHFFFDFPNDFNRYLDIDPLDDFLLKIDRFINWYFLDDLSFHLNNSFNWPLYYDFL